MASPAADSDASVATLEANLQKPSPRVQVVRVALVGCGAVASVHLRSMARLNEKVLRVRFALTAIVDPNASRRAAVLKEAEALSLLTYIDQARGRDEEKPHAAYDFLQQVRPRDFDLALLCVPHHLHEELWAYAANLAPPKHCVIEKPFATTAAGCKAMLCDMLRASANSGDLPLFWVAEQSAYWPEVVKACDLIRQNAIGSLVSVHAHYYESLVSTPFGGGSFGSDETKGTAEHDLGWRKSLDTAGGGSVMDGGLHWLRPLRMFLRANPADSDRNCMDLEVLGSSARHLTGVEGESLCHALIRERVRPKDQMQLQSSRACGRCPVECTFRATVLQRAHLTLYEDPSFRITGQEGEILIYGGTTAPGPHCKSELRLYNREHPHGYTINPIDNDSQEAAASMADGNAKKRKLSNAIGSGAPAECNELDGSSSSCSIPMLGFHGGYPRQWEAIAEALAKRNEAPTAEESEYEEREHMHKQCLEAANDVAIVECIYRSLRSRQWEPVECLESVKHVQ